MFLSAFACMNAGTASRTDCDRQRTRAKTHALEVAGELTALPVHDYDYAAKHGLSPRC